MSMFLTVVDRRGAGEDSTKEEASDIPANLEETARRFKGYVGSDYNPSPYFGVPAERRDVHTLQWCRQLEDERIVREGNFWSLSAGHQVAHQLVTHVRPRGGTLDYTRPVWGYYSAVLGTKKPFQIFAWNTTPALEAIHWAATDEYVLISNRPLLIAMYLTVVNHRATPNLSLDYLMEYLLYGYSVSGRTPFENVNTLSVN